MQFMCYAAMGFTGKKGGSNPVLMLRCDIWAHTDITDAESDYVGDFFTIK